MLVKNNTHYYTLLSRVYNKLPDPDSFSFESSRRMAYCQRMYWEYEYTKLVKGQTFFYTLTYNNKSIPKFLGHNVFSYDDIRLVTNGKLSKVLLRQYGSRLKYLCACESGDGKGLRGFGNNPHYHFIFYVQPLHDDNGKPIYHSYKPIHSRDMLHLIQDIWQGTHGYLDYRKFKFGIAKESRNNGLVDGIQAFSYVSKYVVKDASEKSILDSIQRYYFKLANDSFHSYSTLISYIDFLYNEDSSLSYSDIIDYLEIHSFNRFRKQSGHENFSWVRWFDTYSRVVHRIYTLLPYRDWFDEVYVPQFIEHGVSEYKNKMSSKVRCSKSLGVYGLSQVHDVDTQPRFKFPDGNNGFVVQYPCLYYIRKLYYDVYKCPITGNPLFVLNKLGRQLKIHELPQRIDSLIYNTKQNISYIIKNNIPICESPYSDVSSLDSAVPLKLYDMNSTDVVFKSPLDTLLFLPDFERIIRLYAIRDKVYKYRHYDTSFSTELTIDCLESHYKSDYDFFLQFSPKYLDFEYDTVYHLVQKSTCLSMDTLPCFRNYIRWFDLLDKVNELCFSIFSQNKKQAWIEGSEHAKRLNSAKYNMLFAV